MAKVYYEPAEVTRLQLERSFTYHPPQGDQAERYQLISGEARRLAERFAELAPLSRELSLALTKLEEAVMLANAAIARNEEWVDGRLSAPIVQKVQTK